MSAPMPEYFDLEFHCADLDLRDVGVVCTAVHRFVNDSYLQSKQLKSIQLSRKEPGPLSLQVVQLSHGSLIGKIAPKVRSGWRSLVPTPRGILEGVIGSIVVTLPSSITLGEPGPTLANDPVVTTTIDIRKLDGPIRTLCRDLEATEKTYELRISDPQTKDGMTLKLDENGGCTVTYTSRKNGSD